MSYFVSALPLRFSAPLRLFVFAVLLPQRRRGSQRYAENIVNLRHHKFSRKGAKENAKKVILLSVPLRRCARIVLALIVPVARRGVAIRTVAIIRVVRVVRVYGTHTGSVLIPIVILQYTHIRRCSVRVQVRIDVRGVAVGRGAIATSQTNYRKQRHNY